MARNLHTVYDKPPNLSTITIADHREWQRATAFSVLLSADVPWTVRREFST